MKALTVCLAIFIKCKVSFTQIKKFTSSALIELKFRYDIETAQMIVFIYFSAGFVRHFSLLQSL